MQRKVFKSLEKIYIEMEKADPNLDLIQQEKYTVMELLKQMSLDDIYKYKNDEGNTILELLAEIDFIEAIKYLYTKEPEKFKLAFLTINKEKIIARRMLALAISQAHAKVIKYLIQLYKELQIDLQILGFSQVTLNYYWALAEVRDLRHIQTMLPNDDKMFSLLIDALRFKRKDLGLFFLGNLRIYMTDKVGKALNKQQWEKYLSDALKVTLQFDDMEMADVILAEARSQQLITNILFSTETNPQYDSLISILKRNIASNIWARNLFNKSVLVYLINHLLNETKIPLEAKKEFLFVSLHYLVKFIAYDSPDELNRILSSYDQVFGVEEVTKQLKPIFGLANIFKEVDIQNNIYLSKLFFNDRFKSEYLTPEVLLSRLITKALKANNPYLLEYYFQDPRVKDNKEIKLQEIAQTNSTCAMYLRKNLCVGLPLESKQIADIHALFSQLHTWTKGVVVTSSHAKINKALNDLVDCLSQIKIHKQLAGPFVEWMKLLEYLLKENSGYHFHHATLKNLLTKVLEIAKKLNLQKTLPYDQWCSTMLSSDDISMAIQFLQEKYQHMGSGFDKMSLTLDMASLRLVKCFGAEAMNYLDESDHANNLYCYLPLLLSNKLQCKSIFSLEQQDLKNLLSYIKSIQVPDISKQDQLLSWDRKFAPFVFALKAINVFIESYMSLPSTEIVDKRLEEVLSVRMAFISKMLLITNYFHEVLKKDKLYTANNAEKVIKELISSLNGFKKENELNERSVQEKIKQEQIKSERMKKEIKMREEQLRQEQKRQEQMIREQLRQEQLRQEKVKLVSEFYAKEGKLEQRLNEIKLKEQEKFKKNEIINTAIEQKELHVRIASNEVDKLAAELKRAKEREENAIKYIREQDDLIESRITRKDEIILKEDKIKQIIEEKNALIVELSARENEFNEKLRQEQLRQEQLKQEHLRQEQLKQEQLRQEQLKQEQLRQEQLKQEQLRQEQLRQEQLKQEQLRQEQLKQEQLKQEQERAKQKPIKILKNVGRQNDTVSQSKTGLWKVKSDLDSRQHASVNQSMQSTTTTTATTTKSILQNNISNLTSKKESLEQEFAIMTQRCQKIVNQLARNEWRKTQIEEQSIANKNEFNELSNEISFLQNILAKHDQSFLETQKMITHYIQNLKQSPLLLINHNSLIEHSPQIQSWLSSNYVPDMKIVYDTLMEMLRRLSEHVAQNQVREASNYNLLLDFDAEILELKNQLADDTAQYTELEQKIKVLNEAIEQDQMSICSHNTNQRYKK